MTLDPDVEWIDVSDGLPQRWVTQVAVDPVDPLVAYVTFSGLKWNDPQPHVFRTSSGGLNWVDISSDLPDVPVNAITIDPGETARLFVGTDIGSFARTNTGASWLSLSDGMPAVAVYDLDIHEESRTLFAATHGRSIYRADLPSVPVASEPNSVPAARSILMVAWPNPFTTGVQIRLENSSHAPVIEIFDIRGRLVRTVSLARSHSGTLSVEWDGKTDVGTAVPPGVYVVRSRPASDGQRGAAITVVRLGG